MIKKGNNDKTDELVLILRDHYNTWTQDNDTRRTRPNGWNAVTDAYWGRLPDAWPYYTKVVDPRIQTSLKEKNARLLNAKLRGRLVPREGGDVLKARINNAILDFQWDTANYGGSMLSKWAMMDLDTRMYGSKFGLVKWRYECITSGKETEIKFDGNEFETLDIRDCGWDPSMHNIRDARWFQVRSWEVIEDLENVSDMSTSYDDIGNKKPIYPGLAELKDLMGNDNKKGDRRDNAYPSRVLQLKGLTDRVGEDLAFKVVEIVTEYRPDRWVTFSPKHGVILRDIENPYEHGKIPIVQLKYYPLGDDPIGESEVEPVLPLWKAIQATMCGYLDNMNVHLRPPLKIIDGAVRIETIQWGPEAQWIVDRPDAITEHASSGEPLRMFQTTYPTLVSAFNTAMGDFGQGVSNIDPGSSKRTATEVRASAKQQNTRDQKNQSDLGECIQDMMGMWLSNNRQFLFKDPSKKEYLLRIVGTDLFEYFKRAGLDEMILTPEAMQTIQDIVQQQEGNVSDGDIQQMMEAGKIPKHPVMTNPGEKDPLKQDYKPKMTVNEQGDMAQVTVTPDDLEGNYDYIADVKSMSAGSGDQQSQSRQDAIMMLTGNPVVVQLLQQEGFKPNIKEALVSMFNDNGWSDAERLFSKIEAPQALPQDPNAGMPPQMPQDPNMAQDPNMPQDPNAQPIQDPNAMPQMAQ